MTHPGRILVALLGISFAAPAVCAAVRVDPVAVALAGPGSSYSLLVSAAQPDGRILDRTQAARYVSQNPTIARVTSRGVISAVSDGSTVVVVEVDGQTREVAVSVHGSAEARSYHFVNDVMPLLSRYHCNSSGCHGKAEGQNGFKLSVFGFDPAADLASLVKESRGRRVLPSAPEASLLLRKMSGQAAHGGGARIRAGTAEYETIRGWMADGMPFGAADAPHVESIRVEPAERQLDPRGTQQLRVLARWSDGRVVDVTAHARFQSNNDALASVDPDGLVTAGEVPGEAAVMASYMNAMDTFRVLVPRRERIASYPKIPENNFVDRHVFAKLRKLHVLPSELADDATFLRRVYLDVIGTLPTAAEARQFLADRRPDRRALLVDELLKRPEFADYWALKWADLLRVDRAVLGAKQARAYHRWIRTRLAENMPLDRFARAIITAEGPVDEMPPVNFFKAAGKPGTVSSTLAQVFLGVRIACAECHHHPFDRWSQSDFHGLSAFFTNVHVAPTTTGEMLSVTGVASARHPRSGEMLFAHALGEKMPAKPPSGDRREALAEWMTSPTNPWFSRNLSNRVWAHFLGRGLIEPLDDIRATNPPSNPELLDALAKDLVDSKFDLRALIRIIAASRTYQLSTKPNATNARDAQNYSRALFKRLAAEVTLDMIAQVTGVPERFSGLPAGTRAIQLWDSKVPHYFLKAFGRTERTSACECERNPEPSVAQVLHLMNAPEIEGKLTHAGGYLAKLVKHQPDDSAVVEELYLTFFSRLPEEKERLAALAILKENGTRRQEAVEDLAWGMLNTIEFVFNH
jgi:hypothetical protein